MARIPVSADICRDSLGKFAARDLCVPKAPCMCASTVTEVATSVGTAVAKRTASEVAKSTIKGVGPIAAAFVIIESGHAVIQCKRGKISKEDATERVVCSAAGGVASVGGAALGAVIGTAVFPVIGTAIGGFIGSVLGGLGGRVGASKLMA